jgi:dTDP-4-dehydrorhamnose 3,5-epimerase
VAVDLREGSETFGKWYGLLLSEENKKMFYVPEGFAHGFVTLEDDTEFQYKCTDYYAPEFDAGIIWNDETVGIDWHFKEYGIKMEVLLISGKDQVLPKIEDRKLIENV